MEQVQEAPPVEKKVEAPAALIPITDNALAPTDHNQLIAFIKQMIQAGSIPKHLKTVPEVLCAWNFAAQLKLPPQPSLRNIAVIEGSPSLFGDLPLSLVQRHPDFMFYEEFCINELYEPLCFENKNMETEPWGGVVKLQRKGMDKPQSFTFTRIDADRAGLITRARQGMPWHSYRQVMFIRRARIMAIRALFADALTGAGIAEDFGHAPDLRDVGPSMSIATDLNAKFTRKGVEVVDHDSQPT